MEDFGALVTKLQGIRKQLPEMGGNNDVARHFSGKFIDLTTDSLENEKVSTSTPA
jgi:hypothetical protein